MLVTTQPISNIIQLFFFELLQIGSFLLFLFLLLFFFSWKDVFTTFVCCRPMSATSFLFKMRNATIFLRFFVWNLLIIFVVYDKANQQQHTIFYFWTFSNWFSFTVSIFCRRFSSVGKMFLLLLFVVGLCQPKILFPRCGTQLYLMIFGLELIVNFWLQQIGNNIQIFIF